MKNDFRDQQSHFFVYLGRFILLKQLEHQEQSMLIKDSLLHNNHYYIIIRILNYDIYNVYSVKAVYSDLIVTEDYNY